MRKLITALNAMVKKPRTWEAIISLGAWQRTQSLVVLNSFTIDGIYATIASVRQHVVIDTSVLVAALIGEAGPAREILRRCLKGEYIPLIGNALFSEYEDVTSRPDIMSRCPVTPDEIRTLLNALYSVCKWIPVYYLWRPNLQDEGDNHVVELAIAGQAHWLITQNMRDFKNAELRFTELAFLTPKQILRGEQNGNVNN